MKEREKTIETIKELLFLPKEELVKIVYQAISDKKQLEDKISKIEEYVKENSLYNIVAETYGSMIGKGEDILSIIKGGNYK